MRILKKRCDQTDKQLPVVIEAPFRIQTAASAYQASTKQAHLIPSARYSFYPCNH